MNEALEFFGKLVCCVIRTVLVEFIAFTGFIILNFVSRGKFVWVEYVNRHTLKHPYKSFDKNSSGKIIASVCSPLAGVVGIAFWLVVLIIGIILYNELMSCGIGPNVNPCLIGQAFKVTGN